MMKRLLFIFMAIAAMLVSCKEAAPEAGDQTFSVYDSAGTTPKTVQVTSRGLAKYQLKVMSDAPWTVSVKEGDGWITLSTTSGNKGMLPVVV